MEIVLLYSEYAAEMERAVVVLERDQLGAKPRRGGKSPTGASGRARERTGLDARRALGAPA